VVFATDCKAKYLDWFTATERKGIEDMIWLQADHAAVQENMVEGLPLKSLKLYQHVFEFYDIREVGVILVVDIEKDGGDPKDSGPGGRSMKWVTTVTRFLIAIVQGVDGTKPDSKKECRRILRRIDEQGLLPAPFCDCATVLLLVEYGDPLFYQEAPKELNRDLEADVQNGCIITTAASSTTGNSLRNRIYACAGGNALSGRKGTEIDTVSYHYGVASGATTGGNASLAAAAVTGNSGTDTLTVIENLICRSRNDIVTGGDGNNIYIGDEGADTLGVDLILHERCIGLAGDDTLLGRLGDYAIPTTVEQADYQPSLARSAWKSVYSRKNSAIRVVKAVRQELESLFFAVSPLGCSGNQDIAVTGDIFAYDKGNRIAGVSANGRGSVNVMNACAAGDILCGDQGTNIVVSNDDRDCYYVEMTHHCFPVICSRDNANGMPIGEEKMSTLLPAYGIDEAPSSSKTEVSSLERETDNSDCHPRRLYMSGDNNVNLDQLEINGSGFGRAHQPFALLPETQVEAHRESETPSEAHGAGLLSVPGAITVTTHVGTRQPPLISEITRMVDVRAIRDRRGMTQEEFAKAFGLSVASLRNWEQGTRIPERPIVLYLRLIDKYPNEVMTEVALARANPAT